MAVYIYTGNRLSRSARQLANVMGVPWTGYRSSIYETISNDDTIINWGTTSRMRWTNIINNPTSINYIVNKRTFFRRLREAFHLREIEFIFPEFYLQYTDIPNNNQLIVARGRLKSHSGNGIIIGNKDEIPNNYNLYTKYIPKRYEFRVHIMRGEIIAINRKALSTQWDGETVNWKVRTHKNGFIYVRDISNIPGLVVELVIDTAKQAMSVFPDVDFGAVDIIYNESQNKAYVLEINSAPGITGSLLDNYARGFREIIN